jgi:hypothetical protein
MAYQNYNPNYKGKKRQEQPNVLAIIVVAIFKGLWWLIKLPFGGNRKISKFSIDEVNYIREKRSEVEGLLLSDNIIELKHAVMEADKLVEYALKIFGYAGETFAERLRNAERKLDHVTYQALWDGHKVRNSLAHQQEFRIQNSELRMAGEKLLKYLRNV